MKALILNSGLGSRMGEITSTHPKCMTQLDSKETILSRQLKALMESGINDIVITTGYYDKVLIDYCESLNLPISIRFVKNDRYAETNYIYSIYCAREWLDDDIILMHGDLVFEQQVLNSIVQYKHSCMKVSSTEPIPEKDFKAVIVDGKVNKVGVEFFDSVMEAQALYKLNKNDWRAWLNKIVEYCESGNDKCYAEKALNEIADKCNIFAYDVKEKLCAEIDTEEDLKTIQERLRKIV